MARHGKLPRDISLGKQVKIVGGVGSPGHGVGLCTQVADGASTRVRVLGFDADLRPTTDVSASFDDPNELVQPLSGAAWADGRPALYLYRRPPIAFHVPEGDGPWIDRATAALRVAPWTTTVQEKLLGRKYDPAKGQPRWGVFLPDGWLVGAVLEARGAQPFFEHVVLYPLDTCDWKLVSMRSNDDAINEERCKLLPRYFTQLISFGEQKIAFTGCNLVKSGPYDFKLGRYDLATDELAGVRIAHDTTRSTLAHDGRDRLLLQAGSQLLRYDLTLAEQEAVSADACPFLKSWRLLGGNVEGHTLWMNARAKAICLASPDELAGDLATSLQALQAGS